MRLNSATFGMIMHLGCRAARVTARATKDGNGVHILCGFQHPGVNDAVAECVLSLVRDLAAPAVLEGTSGTMLSIHQESTKGNTNV